MTFESRELAVLRPRRRLAHNRRQLALIAWMLVRPPPGLTWGERAELCDLMTRWLDAGEMREVERLVDQGAAEIEKVLRRSRSSLIKSAR